MTPEGLRHGPFATAVRRHRLIVVLRWIEPQEALLAQLDELADAGARAFEIPLDPVSAEAELTAVRARLDARADGPYLLGAGTVLRRSQLEAARRAGADFAVAPFFDALMVSTAVEEGLPFIPGVLTPTEVAAAWAAGATFVKLFPATSAGPAFVRELQIAMPEAQLIPAGGIDLDSARAFLDAGAAAVGIGSAFTRAVPGTRRAIVEALSSVGERAPA